MKILVKSTSDSRHALYKANVPSFVIKGVIGKVVESDEQLNVRFDWLGQDTIWNLPAECVEIVVNKEKENKNA